MKSVDPKKTSDSQASGNHVNFSSYRCPGEAKFIRKTLHPTVDAQRPAGPQGQSLRGAEWRGSLKHRYRFQRCSSPRFHFPLLCSTVAQSL